MPLTEETVHNTQPGTKPFKLFDEKGLFLLIAPSGGKWWRFKYRFDGKEKSLALGVYPKVSLNAARLGRDKARRLLAHGSDPSKAKREAKSSETPVPPPARPVPRVTAKDGGIIEIGKGRALVCFSETEARFIKDTLSRLLGG